MYGIWYIWYIVYDTWYIVYGIWCMVYSIWNMEYGILFSILNITFFVLLYIIICIWRQNSRQNLLLPLPFTRHCLGAGGWGFGVGEGVSNREGGDGLTGTSHSIVVMGPGPLF